LANHGAVTVGATLDAAWIRMESLEHGARIIWVARTLGRVNELSPEAQHASDGSEMPKGMSKSTAIIQRLLEERRQYEAWIARLNSSADATPGTLRARVRRITRPGSSR